MKKELLTSACILTILLSSCRKSGTTSSSPDTLSGPTPPAVCTNPNVTVSDYAGNGGTGMVNAKYLVSELFSPTAVAQSTSGTVLYASTGRSIRKLYNGDVTTLLTLTGENIDCMATDRLGNIYVGGATTVRKISPAGVLLATYGRMGEYGNSHSPIIRMQLVTGLAIDNTGNIFVCERGNGQVRMIQPDGTSTWVAGGRVPITYADGMDDGPVAVAEFGFIRAVAVNPTGTRIYVADECSVRLIEDGYVSTIAGGASRNITDGNGPTARFSDLECIAIDASENVYVMDSKTDQPSPSQYSTYLRKLIKMNTGLYAWNVTTLAGGIRGHANGTGTSARFFYPQGILVNSGATVGYVADRSNNRVRKLTFNCSPAF